jgi:hypothetical protein
MSAQQHGERGNGDFLAIFSVPQRVNTSGANHEPGN